jgi:hypothetical protein
MLLQSVIFGLMSGRHFPLPHHQHHHHRHHHHHHKHLEPAAEAVSKTPEPKHWINQITSTKNRSSKARQSDGSLGLSEMQNVQVRHFRREEVGVEARGKRSTIWALFRHDDAAAAAADDDDADHGRRYQQILSTVCGLRHYSQKVQSVQCKKARALSDELLKRYCDGWIGWHGSSSSSSSSSTRLRGPMLFLRFQGNEHEPAPHPPRARLFIALPARK